MTQNQISYWSLVETKRSNQAREYETARHNRATESISWANISELVRHNQATENQSAHVLEEQIRHNLIDEQLQHERNMMKVNSAEGAAAYVLQPALTNMKNTVGRVGTVIDSVGTAATKSVVTWITDSVLPVAKDWLEEASKSEGAKPPYLNN